jgi:hypothetical protein
VKNNLHSPSGFPKDIVKNLRVRLHVVGKTAAAVSDGGTDPGTLSRTESSTASSRPVRPPWIRALFTASLSATKKAFPAVRRDPEKWKGSSLCAEQTVQ